MKNLLLSFTMVFTSVAAFAQLYVSPTTTGTDSYVYVKDQILFVEQDIELVPNSTAGTTEASIYLRNDSQLIQGASNSANSGMGSISVYQDINGDSWDYSFVASPVGIPTGTNGNVANSRFNIYDAIGLTESNPASFTAALNGVENPLRISTRWLYNYTNGAYASGSGGSAGIGYTMKGVGTSNHDQIYDFRGRANNGDVSVPITPNGDIMSGNPYPSAIDLNRVFYDPDNVEIESFTYWDEKRDIDSHYYVHNEGGFGTWVPMGDDASGIPGQPSYVEGVYTRPAFTSFDNDGNTGSPTGDQGVYVERRIAPIAQGFIIQAVASDPGFNNLIVFKNSHRRYVKEGAFSQFLRTAETNSPNFDSETAYDYSGENLDGQTAPANPIDTRLPMLRIYTIFGESHARDMVLAFSDASTDQFDRGYDGIHPLDATADVYFPVINGNEEKSCVIQTVPFALDKRVPLSFNIDEQTTVSVKAVEEINMPVGRTYLFDSLENTYQEITNDQAADVLLAEGEYVDRFFIVFEDLTLRVNEELETAQREAEDNIDIFQDNTASTLEVRNPEGYTIKSAAIYDMAGKMVLSENNVGNSTRYSFPTATLSDGIYLVKLMTAEDISIDYKIRVFNKR